MRAPMVGRGAEIAALRESLEEAGAGRRRVALVCGEPGIGKSRLLDEVASIALERDAEVVWGRCWEAGGAPAYWPWTEVLRGVLRTLDEAEMEAMGTGTSRLGQLLPELQDGEERSGVRHEDPDAARFRLFEAVANVLRVAAARRPLVVVLDDLHAADEPSLLLLQFLAAETSPARLLLVAAYRTIDPRPDQALAEAAQFLARLPATTRLTLTGLTRDEVADLTELTTTIAPSETVATRLRDQTDGNPLYVREAARLLAAEGRLGFESDFDRLIIPSDVRETVLRRLRHLPDATERIVTAASVFGREFRIDALAAVCGEDPLHALVDAEAASLVTAVPDGSGRLRFSHAIVAEALYEELPLPTRLDLHRKAGEALEELHAGDLDAHLAEIARHCCAAAARGDAAKAVDYSLRAAERAVHLLAYEEGARLYGLALSTMEATTTWPPATQSKALLGLGDAQARAGDTPAAKATFLRVADLARRTGDGRTLAHSALGYGGRFVWLRSAGDPMVVSLLREALEVVPEDDPALEARLLSRLSGALRDESSMAERDALSARAVDIARRLGDPSVQAYALAARFSAIWGPDAVAELATVASELEALATAANDSERLVDAYLLQFESALSQGQMDLARLCVRRAEELADTLGQPAQRWTAAVVRVVLVLLAGDLEDAEQLIEEICLMGDRVQRWDAGATRALALPLIRWEQGRLAEMEEDLLRARIEYPGYGVLGCMLALLAAESGRPDRAVELIESSADDLPRDNGWLGGMTYLAEAIALLDDPDRARHVYDLLVPYAGLVGVAGGDAATGAVDRSLGQLATVCGRFDDAQQHFESAWRIHVGMPAPTWAAHTAYDWALMLRRRGAPGDEARADELLESAVRTCDELGLTMLADRISRLGVPKTRPPQTRLFRRDGDVWRIAFDGQGFTLRHSKGLQYLATLLARPNTDIAALDLVATPGSGRARHPTEARSAPGDTGPQLDDLARAQYRQRLKDLQAELDESEEWGDDERAARAKAEIDFLAAELAGAVGLRGRPRTTGSPAERARQSVRKAVTAALDRVDAEDPALGRHLRATIRTGYLCRYEPDPRVPVDWQT